MAGKQLYGYDQDKIKRQIANANLAMSASQDAEDQGQVGANVGAVATGLATSIAGKARRVGIPIPGGDILSQDADTINRYNQAVQGAMGVKDEQLKESTGIPSWLPRGARGVATQVPEMLLSGAVGGLPGVIASAAGGEANQAITAARDAGLNESEVMGHALRRGAIEGGVTAGFSVLGGPIGGGVESMVARMFAQGGKEALKSPAAKGAVRQMIMSKAKEGGGALAAELAEELSIGYLGAMEDKWSGVNPSAMNQDELLAMAGDTLVQTIGTMGVVGAFSKAQSAYARRAGGPPMPASTNDEVAAITQPTVTDPEATQPEATQPEAIDEQETPPVLDVLTGVFSDGKPKTAGEIELALEEAGYDLNDPDVQADANAAVDDLLRKGYVADGKTGLISAPGNLTQDRNLDGMRQVLLDNGVSPDVVDGLDPDGLATMAAVIEQQIERSLGIEPQAEADASQKGGDQNEEGNQEGRQGGQGLLESESTTDQPGATTAGETPSSTPEPAVEPTSDPATETKVDEEEYFDGAAQTEPPKATSPAPVQPEPVSTPETQTDGIGEVLPGDLPAAENIERKPRPKYEAEFPGEANTRAAVWTADDGRIAAGLIDDDADENLPITFFTPNDDRPGYARILAEGYAEGLVKRGDINAAAAFAKRATRDSIVPISRAASYYGVERDALENELRPKAEPTIEQPKPKKGPVTKKPKPAPEPKPEPRLIGRNAKGQRVYEDARGVRSIEQGDALVTEKVSLRPASSGLVASIENRTDEYQVADTYESQTTRMQGEMQELQRQLNSPRTDEASKPDLRKRIDEIGLQIEERLGIKQTTGPTPDAKPEPAKESSRPDLMISGQSKPIPGMESEEATYVVHRRKPDMIPDTFSVVVSGRPTGKGWTSVKGTGMTAEDAYDNAVRMFAEKRSTTEATPVVSDQAPVVDPVPADDPYRKGADLFANWKENHPRVRDAANKVGLTDNMSVSDETVKTVRDAWNDIEKLTELVSQRLEALGLDESGVPKAADAKPLSDEELSQRILDAMMGDDAAPASEPTPEPAPAPEEKKGLKKKVTEKKDAAAQDYEAKRGKAINALNKLRNNPSVTSGIPLTPEAVEALRAVADMMVAGVRHKAWSFAEIVADIADQAGNAFVVEFRPFLERGWKAVQAVEKVETPDFNAVFAEYEPGPDPVASVPDHQLANEVKAMLDRGDDIDSKAFFELADRIFGGTRANNVYGDSRAYDALELGVNMHFAGRTDPTGGTKAAKATIKQIQETMAKVPRHKGRTGEKDNMQQFSTPPAYAYAVNWIANVSSDDTALEPSAGIGGIAIHAKNSGARVAVNELSTERLKNLEQLPFDHFFNEDAEQIHAILRNRIPGLSVVVMNPPFSRAGKRMGNKMVQGTDRKHMEKALALLPEGGRLVAIVGAGLHEQQKGMTNWLANLPFAVRANVEVARDVYRGYGTEFPTRVLVIDKVPRAGFETVSGEAADLGQLIDLLEDVRNDRQPVRRSVLEQEQDQPSGETSPGTIEDSTEPTSPTRDGVGGLADEGATGIDSTTDNDGTVGSDAGASVSPDATATESTSGSDGKRPGGRRIGGRKGGKSGTKTDGGQTTTDSRDVVGKSVDNDGTGVVTPVDAASISQADRAVSELSESTYEAYRPSIQIPGAVKHPAPLVESAAMAAVNFPQVNYQVHIPEKTIKGYTNENGVQVGVSDIQLESIAAAGYAHSQMLPDGSRRGFLIGDGTGVGKAREATGIMMDNWNQGRQKAVWITKSDKLEKQAREEWEKVGGNPNLFKKHGNIGSGEKITDEKGIYFSTYGTIPQLASDTARSEGNGLSRLEQLVDWLGADFDGVIVFDEAHLMGNATDSGEGRSRKPASKRALAGVDLQMMLPNARVVYLSATAATEVSNLAYAQRLGLWGEGTQFSDMPNFLSEITRGGVAAMEKVAADMKAMGMYLARNISFNDGTPKGTVEFERVTHELTPDQAEGYDKMSEAWNKVFQNIGAALEMTEGDGHAKGRALSQFWSANQRFWNQVITAMQVPTMISEIETDLKEGRSVLIQLTSTNEAATNRAIESKDKDADLDEIDTSPRYILMDFLERSFPTQMYEEYMDENGNTRKRPVVDSEGNPVHDPEAMALKNALLDELGALQVADRGALDMVIDHFGEEMVAEITGRSQRIIRKNGKSEIQKRGKAATSADHDSFMDGKKRILAFSEAGGTGADYHASLARKNQERRAHYVLQPGWRADVAVQGLGRGHRSNQASAPIIKLMQPNLNGYKRFISTIARRLSQLGALTKGSREAGDSGVFSASDNLESTEARAGLVQFFNDAIAGNIEGISGEYLETRLGLRVRKEDGSPLATLPAISQMMNRVLNLPIEEQNYVFDQIQGRIDTIIEAAIANGTLDQGMETIKAESVVKKSEQVVNVHSTGAETKHVVLTVRTKTDPRTPQSIARTEGVIGHVRSAKTGKVFAMVETNQSEQDAQGRISRKVKLLGVGGTTVNTDRNLNNETNWIQLSPKEFRDAYQAEFDSFPEFKEEEMHLLAGALLPVWGNLPEGTNSVKRALTTDGEQILGREIKAADLEKTLRRLGAVYSGPQIAVADAMEVVRDGGNLELSNGWRIKRSVIQGEENIEIINVPPTEAKAITDAGGFSRRLDYKVRYFIPIGKEGDAVLEKLLSSGRAIVEVNYPEGRSGSANFNPGLQPRSLDADAKVKLNNATPNAPVRSADDDKAGIAAADVSASLDRIFGTTTRIGSVRGKALGQYMGLSRSENVPRVVRLAERAATSIAVKIHEIAHHLDRVHGIAHRKPGLSKLSVPRSLRNELSGLDYSPEGRLFEGWAEFLRIYLTEPNTVDANGVFTAGPKAKAPNFTKWFEGTYLPSKPELKKQIDDARKYVDKFADQSLIRKMRAMIGNRPGDDLEYTERFKKNAAKRMTELRTDWEDQFYQATVIDKAYREAGGEGPGIRDVINVHQYASNAEAERALNDGVHDIATGKRISKRGFWTTVSDLLKTDQERLDAEVFAYARHTVWAATNKPGYFTGMDPKEAQALLDDVQTNDPDQHKRFEKIALAISDTAHDLLKMRVAAGTMPKDLADRIIDEYGDNYFPMFRAMDGQRSIKGNGSGFVNVSISAPRRSRKGSGRPVLSPFESIEKMANDYYALAGRGRVNERLRNMIDPEFGGVEGLGWVGVRVSAKMKVNKTPIEKVLSQLVSKGFVDKDDADASIVAGQILGQINGYPSDEALQDFADRHGIDVGDMQAMEDAAQTEPSAAEQLSVWAPSYEAEPGKMIAVSYTRDGSPLLYEYDADIYNMLTNLSDPQMALTSAFIKRLGKTFKSMAVTANMSFAVLNAVRDYFTYQGRASKVKGFKTFTEPFNQLRRYVRYKASNQDPSKAASDLMLFDQMGGSSFSRVGRDQAGRSRSVQRRLGKTRMSRLGFTGVHPRELLSATGAVLANVRDKVEGLVSISDAPPRLAEMAAAIKARGYTPLTGGRFRNESTGHVREGLPEDVRIEAMMAASNATVNFKRGGRRMKALDVYMPFALATVNANLRFAKEATNMRNIGQNTPEGKQAGRYAAYLAATAAMSVLYYALRRDEDDYRNAEDYELNKFWTFGWNGTTYVRIPKPQDEAFVSNIVEALMGRMFGEADSRDLMTMLIDDVTGRIPAGGGIVRGGVEVVANKDFYRGRKIEPEYVQDLSTRNQYTDDTRQLSVLIGQVTSKLGISPMQAEHLINSVTASQYEKMHRLVEGVHSGTFSVENLPGVRALMVNRHTSRPISDFYDRMGELKTLVADAKKDGEGDSAETIKAKAEYAKLENYQKLMGVISEAQRKEPGDRYKYTPYLVGLAREALGYEPVKSSPSPMKAQLSTLPTSVSDAIKDLAKRTVEPTMLIQGVPQKVPKDDAEGLNRVELRKAFVQVRKEFRDSVDADLDYLEQHKDDPAVKAQMRETFRSKRFQEAMKREPVQGDLSDRDYAADMRRHREQQARVRKLVGLRRIGLASSR
jgi:predicted RNA methylase